MALQLQMEGLVAWDCISSSITFEWRFISAISSPLLSVPAPLHSTCFERSGEHSELHASHASPLGCGLLRSRGRRVVEAGMISNGLGFRIFLSVGLHADQPNRPFLQLLDSMPVL